MQEDNSMFDKILGDLERIISNYINSRLKSFSIVPVTENKNKSPILCEPHNNGEEYHLGLESWCVKHIYKYASTELFKIRRLLKKNKLSFFQMETLNKFLIGALLINPEVTTFWNMKRELVEQEVLNIEEELSFTKLVLTYKSKSNDVFSYRRWLLKKLLSNIKPDGYCNLLPVEFTVTEEAAEKSENNYHAWTHRIWCLENFLLIKNVNLQSTNDILCAQLDFSLGWINNHISQHSGYHYRQFLINCTKNNNTDGNHLFNNYLIFVKNTLGLSLEDISDKNIFLNKLLDETVTCRRQNGTEIFTFYGSSNYVCVLLYELFNTLKRLCFFYVKHETVWYHRKFVIYHLLQWMYDCYGIEWKPEIKLTNVQENNYCNNIVDKCVKDDSNKSNLKFAENGEKYAKLFKYETDRLESSLLYRTVVQSEFKIVKELIASDCPHVKKLAERYERWLRNIACL